MLLLAAYLVALISLPVVIQTQVASPRAGTSPPLPVFKYEVKNTLALSQQELNDWKEGDKSVFDLKSSHKSNATLRLSFAELTCGLKFQLGITRDESTDSLGYKYRPTDNELAGETKVVFPCGFVVDPFISASFKTQVAESFKMTMGKLTATAKLWDPVTSDETLGFSFAYVFDRGKLSMRSGGQLQQIRAANYTLLTDDPKTPKIFEKYKATAGGEIAIDAQIKIDSLVIYTGKFSAKKNALTNSPWQLSVENEFRVRLWKYLGFVVNINASHDAAITKRVQYKQNLSFGLMLDF